MLRLGGWTKCQELKEMQQDLSKEKEGMWPEEGGLFHDVPPL